MRINENRQTWCKWTTILLVVISVLATEIALTPQGQSWPWSRMLDMAVASPFLAIIAWSARRSNPSTRNKLPILAVGMLVVVFILPLIYYLLFSLIERRGFLLEVALLSSLRNLAIGTALLSRWQVGLRTSALCSLFLAVYATVISDGIWLHVTIGLYSAFGCIWLLLNYWNVIPIRGMEARFPILSAILIATLIGATMVIGFVGPAKAAQALAGFLPSSGGTKDYDPDSRGGTNDGEDTVRGTQESRSTGFTDSEFFLDSPDDSLYDVTHDLYGDAIKPKNWERAIALPAEKMIKKDLIPAESLQASREFSLLRQPPKQKDEPLESHGAHALAYVQGRAPAHLPVTAYDHFDGVLWSEADRKTTTMDLANDGKSPWMHNKETADIPVFASSQLHVVKVAKFKTASLPIPGHMTRFRVGKINQRSFFTWAQEGIVRLADREIPKGTIVEAETQTVDYPTISENEWDWTMSTMDRRYLSQPVNEKLEKRLVDLAQEWAGNQPRGWKQIEAIVNRLRTEYIFDKRALPPADSRDVVSHFLTIGRGRDIDFATTTVMLLRTLGYPCRLVSGLYVHPDHYDAKTEHYMVYRDDVHFWVEILVGHKLPL